MAMMTATHAAVGYASGFVAIVFVAGLALFLWARRK